MTPDGELPTDAIEARPGRLDDRHRVGARLPADLQDHGRHAVEAGEGALLFGAVLGATDVAHADGRTVSGGDDEVVELLGLGEAAHRPQRLLAQVGRDVAARHIGVLLLQRGPHFGDRELVGRESIGFDPDVDGACQTADDLHFADPRRPFERQLDHLIGQFGELADRQIAGQRDRQHR